MGASDCYKSVFFLCQNRIEDLKQERKTVEDQMAMARDELQKAKDLAKMLTDSKTVRNPSCAALPSAFTVSFASGMNPSTLYSGLLMYSPASNFTPACSQAPTRRLC